MLRVILSLVGLVAVPILFFLAWLGWNKSLRAELPAWRNGLCMSCLVLLSVNWLVAAILEVPTFMSPQTIRPAGLMEGMLTISHPLNIIVIVLAFALRRAPRLQAGIAALLMLVSWPLGYA